MYTLRVRLVGSPACAQSLAVPRDHKMPLPAVIRVLDQAHTGHILELSRHWKRPFHRQLGGADDAENPHYWWNEGRGAWLRTNTRIAKLRTRPCRESLEWFCGVIGMEPDLDRCPSRAPGGRSDGNKASPHLNSSWQGRSG